MESKAAQPNKKLNPLAVLVGQWNTQGAHPAMPGVALYGHAEFSWIEGGAFLRMKAGIDHEQFPDGIAIFGSDDSTDEYSMSYFDERGISRQYRCTLRNKVWTWWRDDKDFSQKFAGTISEDGNTITLKGQMRRNGGDWEGDLELVYKRA